MTAHDLLTDLQKRPFEPLRLYVTDGTVYDIRHPEQCMVLVSSVIVGIPAKPGTMPFERSVRIDNSHILKVEPITAATSNSGGSLSA